MLKARVIPGLPGCQQQTYVPMDAFWAGMSANAASIDRLAGFGSFPSTQQLQNG
jgi:hypothetical protein